MITTPQLDDYGKAHHHHNNNHHQQQQQQQGLIMTQKI